MPVIEQNSQDYTSRNADDPYGCHNRLPFNPIVRSSGPGAVTSWPNRFSQECRYDRSLTDLRCSGCRHAGSGEAYVAAQEARGAK
jgi:hypothetical protein